MTHRHTRTNRVTGDTHTKDVHKSRRAEISLHIHGRHACQCLPHRLSSSRATRGVALEYLARWLSETHRDTLSAQRAAATNSQRAEVKVVTCAQLFEAGS